MSNFYRTKLLLMYNLFVKKKQLLSDWNHFILLVGFVYTRVVVFTIYVHIFQINQLWFQTIRTDKLKILLFLYGVYKIFEISLNFYARRIFVYLLMFSHYILYKYINCTHTPPNMQFEKWKKKKNKKGEKKTSGGKYMLHEKANTWNKIEGRLLLNNLSNSHAEKQSNAHQSYTRCYHNYYCIINLPLNDENTLTVWE